jgi:hypothetical protein
VSKTLPSCVANARPDAHGIPGQIRHDATPSIALGLRFRHSADVSVSARHGSQDTANAVGWQHPPGFKSPILRSEVFTLQRGLFSRLGSASPRGYCRLGPGQMRPRGNVSRNCVRPLRVWGADAYSSLVRLNASTVDSDYGQPTGRQLRACAAESELPRRLA